MANAFKNSITGSIGTSGVKVYETPLATSTTVIGVNVANVNSNNISVINFSSYYACLYTDLKQKVNFSAFNSQTGKVNSFELRYNLVNPKNAKKIDLYFNKFTRFDDKFYYFHKEKNNYVLFEMSVVLNE